MSEKQPVEPEKPEKHPRRQQQPEKHPRRQQPVEPEKHPRRQQQPVEQEGQQVRRVGGSDEHEWDLLHFQQPRIHFGGY